MVGHFAEFNIYNSLFTNHLATGNGAKGDDQNKCSVKPDDGQYQTGSGGNSGAIYNEGISRNVLPCGNAIPKNKAGQGAFGGGLFSTSNDFGERLSLADTAMSGNLGGSWTHVDTGTVKHAVTAVGPPPSASRSQTRPFKAAPKPRLNDPERAWLPTPVRGCFTNES
jgi:hypothetical protein